MTLDIDRAVAAAQSRVVPWMDSVRAGAIAAHHQSILRLKQHQNSLVMSPQARSATDALIRLYSARIYALSREVA